jgi:H+/gluconate symporter-like permease
VLAYILAALIRLIQGSATVAMMTAGALMAGIMATLTEPLGAVDKALVVLAVAFGGTIASHVNDSGFWLVSRYLGLSEKETLKSWTVMETIVSVVGFGLVLVVSAFV